MSLNQKKFHLIAILILMTFFVKGIFLTTILPMFKGQDESRHYNTIQFLNEPKEKTWEIKDGFSDNMQDKRDLSTYRFSEEIKDTAWKTETHRLRYNKKDTITFTNSFNGKNEMELKENSLPAVNKSYPVDVVNGSLYHKIGSLVEKSLENKNIFVKFYSIRILSLILVTISLYFAYLTLKTIGLSRKNTLIILALTTFQPALSLYATNINYDSLLILSFSIFIYGGVLYLKQGINKKNSTLLVLSTILGILTKGTGIVLVFILMGIIFFETFKKAKKYSKKISYSIIILLISILILTFSTYTKHLPVSEKGLPEIIISLDEYALDTINLRSFAQTSETYWGIINLENKITDNLKYILVFIDFLSFIGILIYFFVDKNQIVQYLPKKKYTLFFVIMVFALQAGVRLAGWKYFDQTGDVGLGAPGRYFLPTLVPHLCLIYIGIGTILSVLKIERALKYLLIISLLLLFYLSFDSILNTIIYRYYLL